MSVQYDVAIIGSGFSGSILARILASCGRRVVLLDAAKHPRFAIGESSTPIADLLLRRLGQQYKLPDLENLSSYGRWQLTNPELACGLKRGFSYFDHRKTIHETYMGERSLIVAASPTDSNSDTHWYRSDIDAFLFHQAIKEGVVAKEEVTVTALDLSESKRAKIHFEMGEGISADFVVDASGAGAVAARLLRLPALTHRLTTRTCASYAHYRGVESFAEVFNSVHGDDRACQPFDADAAAQHHLLDAGWAWMLRMNNGITSVGITSPLTADDSSGDAARRRSVAILDSRFKDYATLNQIIRRGEIVAPPSGITSISRIQRLYDPFVAPNCLMMPTTAVTIDPLHSTGIAHAIAGVERVAEIVLNSHNAGLVDQYRVAIIAEAIQIDRMISLAYRSMHSFQRFTTACMVYFAAAIACEERIGSGEMPARLWQSDDESFVKAVGHCAEVLCSDNDDRLVQSLIRKLIAPWNNAGLLESADNRYAYTATK